MHRYTKILGLTIGCLFILTACGQPASVGVPTSEVPARAVTAATATPSVAVNTPETSLQPTADVLSTEIMETATPEPTMEPEATPTAEPQATAVPRATRPPAANPAVACNKQIIYVVKPGDNLYRIALRYKTTIAAIARRNGITNVRQIRSGQRLRITTCAR